MATRTTDQQADLDTEEIRSVVHWVDRYLQALSRSEKSEGRRDFGERDTLVVRAQQLLQPLSRLHERADRIVRDSPVMLQMQLEAFLRNPGPLQFSLEGLKRLAGDGAIGQDINDHRRSLESVRDHLEALARWTTRQERGPEGPDPLDEPSIPTPADREVIREVVVEQIQADKAAVRLGTKAQAAEDIIMQHGPIIGEKVITKMKEQGHSYKLTSLSAHIVPKLKLRGMKNDGEGYYYPPT